MRRDRRRLLGVIASAAVFAARAALAHAAAADPQSHTELLARTELFGAAYRNAAEPAPGGAYGMRFVPGRGLVRWAVAGKTPDEAREAEVEAMGLADAHAVQAEIDAEAASALAAPPASALAYNGAATPGSTSDLTLGPSRAKSGIKQRLTDAVGLRDGDKLRGHGRFYIFGAGAGRGVGWNVAHDGDDWRSEGLTADKGGFAGQRQAGLAWRVGGAQASLSYVHDKIKTQLLGLQSYKDDRVMLGLSFTPFASKGSRR